ncbi:MAG: chromosomal replication initiator protein DnaA [Candidatus Eisenbacteria bacterium]|nr:chromosomal replication initiator protein DnaA [Candidatus Eisenbacteria bacterium]
MSVSYAEKTWNDILSAISQKVNTQSLETWFRPIKPVVANSELLLLQVSNNFIADWMEEHYVDLICEAASGYLGANFRVNFCIQQDAPDTSEETSSAKDRSLYAKPTGQNGNQLNSKFTFDSFVVGGANNLAHAACRAVAENPAYTYNPLFIYGGTGLGKTHLMQAIGHVVMERQPASKVFYVSSEKFTTELIYSIQHGRTMEFKNKYRAADLLLIDDIQFLVGKETTQEEFFHTFNSLYDAHRQIVLTSDRPPKELDMLEDRLISRFSWGLVADIQAPDLETRVAILKKNAEFMGFSLSNDIALLVASSIKSNIRELEGSLVRLVAFANLTGKHLVPEVVQDVLRDFMREEIKAVDLPIIQQTISKHYGISEESLKGKKRTNSIAFPRQVGMYLARQLTELSLAEIGQRFGNRDHTTVLYACEKITSMIMTDKAMKESVDKLTEEILSSSN